MHIDTLFKVSKGEDTEFEIELADASHPIFQAHFPTKPILPGYCHFEIISQLFGVEITGIKKTKFLKMALPQEVLRYKQDGKKYEIFDSDNKSVAQISLQ